MIEPDTRTHFELGLMQGFPPPPDKVVTAENGLWVPPYNRWAYQNMRRLLPSSPIARSASPLDVPRRAVAGLDDIEVLQPDGPPASLQQFLDATYTDAMVVLHDGGVAWEYYANGMLPSSPHQMMSCTKSFIGLFALLAAHDGRLRLDEPVGERLPELAASGFADATAGQVIDMTNALEFDETYDDPAADIHAYAAIVGLGQGDAGSGPATLHEYLATLRRDDAAEHGAVFHYQTPKSDVVNWLTNRATRRSLFDDLDDLWQRMGGRDEAYMLVDRAGAPVAGGGLNASPEDLARFCLAAMDPGGPVPSDVLDEIEAGGSVDAFLAGPDAIGVMQNGHWSYRAQWWVRTEPGREAITAIGVNGQWIYLDRRRRVGIVKQSSQPIALDPWSDDLTIAAFDRIIDVVTRPS